jgi:transposase InsO family protein
VPTPAGWLYLAVVIDLASRRVVGWAMRDDLAAELSLSALCMALEARRPAPRLLHHADRGVQYACGEYRDLLEAHGLRASMSRRGNYWDNAVVESFFANIETWYNRRRRHSTLDYLSPTQYEAQLHDVT